MNTILYDEYLAENSQRNYPFADDASRTADNGYQLPAGVILDMFVYPLGASNLYISQLDGLARVLYLSDTATDAVVGTADVRAGTTCMIVDNSPLERTIGSITYAAFADTMPAQALVFTPTAGAIAAGAICVVPAYGITTLIGGTIPVAGNALVAGTNGVTATTYTDEAGVGHLRVDALGVAPTALDGCTGPVIRCLRIIVDDNSPLKASVYDVGIIALTGNGVTLEDICPAKRLPTADGVLPARSPCAPEPNPTPIVAPPSATIFTLCVTTGTIDFITPSVTGSPNPFKLTLLQSVSNPGDLSANNDTVTPLTAAAPLRAPEDVAAAISREIAHTTLQLGFVAYSKDQTP